MGQFLHLMKKKIDLERSPVLYHKNLKEDLLESDWKIYSGDWWLEDGWLNGRNPGNFPGMIVSRLDFPGNVMVEFEARTLLPCTHDINFMWNGSWDEVKNQRGIAYVAGLEGWWDGKVGIEKSPEYKLNAGTPLLDFEPGKSYRILGGSIDGHCFICADGKLLLEVTDPEPIDSSIHMKVGFEAYCSHIQIRNIIIRQILWEKDEKCYIPEF